MLTRIADTEALSRGFEIDGDEGRCLLIPLLVLRYPFKNYLLPLEQGVDDILRVSFREEMLV
jgi:hypothetical protein